MTCERCRQLEDVLARTYRKMDGLRSPIERGSDFVARTVLGTIDKYLDEGGVLPEELSSMIQGALSEAAEAWGDELPDDLARLWQRLSGTSPGEYRDERRAETDRDVRAPLKENL